jgi:hypothetical protein
MGGYQLTVALVLQRPRRPAPPNNRPSCGIWSQLHSPAVTRESVSVRVLTPQSSNDQAAQRRIPSSGCYGGSSDLEKPTPRNDSRSSMGLRPDLFVGRASQRRFEAHQGGGSSRQSPEGTTKKTVQCQDGKYKASKAGAASVRITWQGAFLGLCLQVYCVLTSGTPPHASDRAWSDFVTTTPSLNPTMQPPPLVSGNRFGVTPVIRIGE